MSVRPVYIQAVGMACPLGLTAASACAAMRAGLDRKQELPYLDNQGRPIIGSYFAPLGHRLTAQQRSMELLTYALQDLLRHRRHGVVEQLPAVFVLPPGPSGQAISAGLLATKLSTLPDFKLDSRLVQSLTGEASAGYQALAYARSLLTQRIYRSALVCTADSLINASKLLQLSKGHRLLTEDNPDGVIPGEAAACILLSLERNDAHGIICGLGFGQEPALLTNDLPLRGDGIVAAAQEALTEAGLAMHDMDVRLSDAAGESYQFKEQTLAISRLLRRNKASFPLWLSALTLGDTGIAAGMCNILTATHAFAREYFPGQRAIAYAGSQAGQRAALVLERPTHHSHTR